MVMEEVFLHRDSSMIGNGLLCGLLSIRELNNIAANIVKEN